MTDYRDTTTELALADRRGQVFNVLAHGATRGGDLGVKINDLIELVAGVTPGGTVLVPWGAFNLETPIIKLPNVNLLMDKRARITAQQAMDSMIVTPVDQLCEDEFIAGGVLLCNNLADVGIDAKCFRHLTLDSVLVEDWLTSGILLGDPLQAQTSYEGILRNVRTHRRTGSAPASSIALRIQSATDCLVQQSVLIGGETGVKTETQGNFFGRVHCWVRQGLGELKKGFHDTVTGNVYESCYADAPTVYGFHLERFSTILSNCVVQLASWSVDNVTSGVRFDQATPFASLIGCRLQGYDATHRLAKDIDFGPGTGQDVNVLGLLVGNCVTLSGGTRIGTGRVRVTADLETENVDVTGEMDLQGPYLNLSATDANIPDFSGTGDSVDGATDIGTTGVVVRSVDDDRQVLRFRASGTANAGSGGTALGWFDLNDFLVHRMDEEELAVDFLNYFPTPDTITRVLTLDKFGNLTVVNARAGVYEASAAAGSALRGLHIMTAGVLRWALRGNADAETGSNAGTNLELVRRNDDGSVLGTVILINRATGKVTATDGALDIAATYLKPLGLDTLRLWRDTGARIRIKDASDPGSATDGTPLQEVRYGTTANRPASPPDGWMYVDSTIGKPVWYIGGGWKDATGAAA